MHKIRFHYNVILILVNFETHKIVVFLLWAIQSIGFFNEPHNRPDFQMTSFVAENSDKFMIFIYTATNQSNWMAWDNIFTKNEKKCNLKWIHLKYTMKSFILVIFVFLFLACIYVWFRVLNFIYSEVFVLNKWTQTTYNSIQTMMKHCTHKTIRFLVYCSRYTFIHWMHRNIAK